MDTLLKSKVREVEDNTREVITRRISTEVLVCVQYIKVKKKLLVWFQYGNKRDINSCSIWYVYLK